MSEATLTPPRHTLTASPAMLAAAQRRRAAVAVEAPKADRKPRSRGRRTYDPAIDAMLRERWPVAFCVPRVPLAVGVREQILDVIGAEVAAKALGLFLAWWTQRSDYLDAVCHGEARRNLDGSPAGEPDEAQRRQAAGEVYGARAEQVLARIAARRDV
jgi:ProQ/FINO family